MHVAGAVHQNIQPAEFIAHHLSDGIDTILRPHVELDALRRFDIAHFILGDIGGDHFAALSRERLGNGAANALPGRRDQRQFTLQPVAHAVLLRRR